MQLMTGDAMQAHMGSQVVPAATILLAPACGRACVARQGSARDAWRSPVLLWRLIRGALLVVLAAACLSLANAEESRNGLIVSLPNGYATLNVEDMRLMSTARDVRWVRRWDGQEWKFQPQWESLSQSWKNLTGSQSADNSAGAVSAGGGTGGASLSSGASGAASGGAGAGCWVWVDEDWQPSVGDAIIGGIPDSGPMLAVRTTPFNRLMGDDSEAGVSYPTPQRVSVDYASLCVGFNVSSGSSVRDTEGIRRINELYLGDSGRYAFNNRSVLEKRAVQQLPPEAAASLYSQMLSGSITLNPQTNTKGFRWIDRGGDWIDYNTQGQVVAYGERNNNTIWMLRDTGGTLRGVIDANGRVLWSLHYTGELVTEIKDFPVAGLAQDLPARSVKYAYDVRNRLTQVTDVRGNVTQYDYDAANRIVRITDPQGHAETLSYIGDTVKQRTAPDGGITDYAFSYDDANKQFISKITGPETAAGRRVEDFTQNRASQLVRRIFNGQTDAEMRYDTGARSESATNARGFTTRTTRNEFDQRVEVVNPDGTSVKYAYSALNLGMTESTDEAGIKTLYLRDAKGNLLKVTQAFGTPDETVIEYERNALGHAVKTTRKGRTEANGTVTLDAVWLSEFDDRGRIQKITDPEGHVHRYVFNRAGNTVGYTDPRGYSMRFEVNAEGLLTKVTDARGRVVSIAHDKLGNTLSQTDARGKIAQMAYDAMSRVTQYTNPIGGAYKIQYNGQGLPTQETDEDGRTSTLEFDNLLRLTKQVDPLGNATQYSYQIPDGTQAGQVGALQDPTEIQYPTFTQRLRYDQRERQTSRTLLNPNSLGTEGLVSSTVYDQRGRATSATDPNGKTRFYAYDALGQLRETTDSLGNKTRALYDMRGNLLQITDAKGNASKFEYDRNNRVVKEIQPLGQTTAYSYDPAGNLTERNDANGNRATYTFDEVNRVGEVKQYLGGTVLARTTTYTWDDTDNLIAWSDIDHTRPAGQQTTSASANYDDANRLTGETITYPTPAGGSHSLSYGYTYSLAGYKTRLTWPDGTAIDYGHSAHGELETVTIPGEGSISVNEFKWFAPAKVTLPGGTTQERTLDGLLQLEGLKVKTPGQQTVLSVANTFGKVQELKTSNRTDATDAASATKSSSFGYDDEIRLTQATVDSGGVFGTDTENFTLDAVGNRIAHSKVTGAWTYDTNNRLTQRGTGGNATTYEYDAAGNLKKKTEPGTRVTQYSYDTQNRLVEIKDGAGQLIARYGYDPLDRRTWREQYRDLTGASLAQAKRSHYLYADEGLVAESQQDITLNADGSVSAGAAPAIGTQYGPRPDSEFTTGMLFIKTRNSNNQDTVAYYHHDQIGTPVQATDKAGNIVWSAYFNAFGKASINTPAATADKPTITSNLRLPGQVEDPETGLHYNYRRYYDASTGRYITQDPIGLAGGINQYRYAGADPVNLIDPTGEIVPAIVAAAELIALCSAECTLMDVAVDAISGECVDVANTAKECAKNCALTLGVGWAVGRAWKYGKRLWESMPCALNSFPADTLVHVKPRGATEVDARSGKSELIAISQLKIGDEVLSFAEWKDKSSATAGDERLSYEKVVDVFTNQMARTLVHLTLDNGQTLTATDGHPFKTTEGWRDAIMLKRGGKLLIKGGDSDSDVERVNTITDMYTEQKTLPVFNIEVANAHTFLVGESGEIVHNGCKPSRAAKGAKTVAEAGADLAKDLGRNRVSARTAGGKQIDIDLAGRGHFDKATGTMIETPHVQTSNLNVGPNGRVSASNTTHRSATMDDIRTARKISERE